MSFSRFIPVHGRVFDGGSGNYLRTHYHLRWQAARPMSVGAWIKRDTLGQQDAIFWTRLNGGWHFGVNASDRLAFTFFNVADSVGPAVTVAVGEWVHVGVTVGSLGTVRFYLAGDYIGVGSPALNAPDPNDGATFLYTAAVSPITNIPSGYASIQTAGRFIDNTEEYTAAEMRALANGAYAHNLPRRPNVISFPDLGVGGYEPDFGWHKVVCEVMGSVPAADGLMPLTLLKRPDKRSQLMLAIATAGGGAAALEGFAQAQASASGVLTTEIPLLGAAVVSSSAQGALSTSIDLAGSAAVVSIANGELTAQIRLEGAAIAQAAATGDITTAINLSGAAIAQALAQAGITTAIPLTGSAAAQGTATGELSGSATALQGSAIGVVVAAGDLTTGIPLQGVAVAVSGAAGALVTEIRLTASALAQAIAAGALSAEIRLSAAAVVQALATGELSTVTSLVASPGYTATLARSYQTTLNRTFETAS